jgi:hypothetical protein
MSNSIRRKITFCDFVVCAAQILNPVWCFPTNVDEQSNHSTAFKKFLEIFFRCARIFETTPAGPKGHQMIAASLFVCLAHDAGSGALAGSLTDITAIRIFTISPPDKAMSSSRFLPAPVRATNRRAFTSAILAQYHP